MNIDIVTEQMLNARRAMEEASAAMAAAREEIERLKTENALLESINRVLEAKLTRARHQLEARQ